MSVEAAEPTKAASRWSMFEQKTAELDRALSSRPFGEPGRAVAAARALVAWADEVGDDLADARVGPEDARHLLLVLCDEARKIWDYDAARQLAWAFQVIYRETPGAGDPQIDRLVKVLDQRLGLTLAPSGQAPIESALANRLRTVADYSPDDFHKTFAALADRLSARR